MNSRNSKLQAAPLSANAVLKGEIKGFKQLLPFLGPAFIAAVAYIDPGNFATNMTAGSEYGYMLLWVIVFANLMAVVIQSLSAKLGIATGKNLPEVARDHFSKRTSILLWIQAEFVIIATDLAEFIGAALGLYLVFHIPMLPSALITAAASFVILELQRRGFRTFEVIVSTMVLLVVLVFAFQTFRAQPEPSSLLSGLTPQFDGLSSILLATGILGATVMPHAIYLHSALTQKRVVGRNEKEKKKIFTLELIDIIIAMFIAGAINIAMLVIAAAVFHTRGIDVTDLQVAHDELIYYLGPVVGISFGLGLLIAGLASSAVGTLAGDIVMQGFINRRIPIYLRRTITMLPPIIIIAFGLNATTALVWSQVILSFGIAFALVPLLLFTSDKKIMGGLVNHKITTLIGWTIAAITISLNAFLLYSSLSELFFN